MSKPTNRIRPVECGLSVSRADLVYAQGSTGPIVKLAGDNSRYMLTCGHVLTPPYLDNHHTNKGVIQQGLVHGGHPRRSSIGKIKSWSPLKFTGQTNHVDLALVELSIDARNSIGIRSHVISESNILSETEQKNAHGIQVLKRGATTNTTTGVIENTNWHGQIKYKGPNNWKKRAFFRGLISIRSIHPSRPFSKEGDSGALVISKDNSKVIGIIVAGVGRISLVQPIWRTLIVHGRWNATIAEHT